MDSFSLPSVMQLSSEQKAAMAANLQLELANRTEKLRAMCEAQVASFRSKLERRVNRIPASKRQLKMGDLVAPPAEPKPASTTNTTAAKRTRAAPARIAPAPKQRNLKRTSDEAGNDKENSTAHQPPATKKRTRVQPATNTTTTRQTRTTSRQTKATAVLSPKNDNQQRQTRTTRQRPR
ncbi:hypothetical protein BDV96DRAFT_585694 [Lophiotrema nucula]|uniref:Borealin N-terminal domain-containing protein n=1 Tax=Lophiotrema nucula TaxID=690887 RepID=A0A6A5YQS9_9PLEO|nr:hypothetical protein BDV96DRAFT_585694 [Lophiotrema nucula]